VRILLSQFTENPALYIRSSISDQVPHSLLLGKTPLTKKAHKKSLMSIQQSLMAGPKLPGWVGKRWCIPESGRGVAFIEGGVGVKEISACTVVSGRVGLSYSTGISVKGWGCHFG
jgi:hypothetical protein